MPDAAFDSSDGARLAEHGGPAISSSRFGPGFDPKLLELDTRFVFELPCRIASEALSQAYQDTGAGQQPHRLRFAFFRSYRLDAGTCDTGSGESMIAISDSWPVSLLHAFSRLVPMIDTATLLPRCDASGRVVVLEQPLELTGAATTRRRTRSRTEELLPEVLQALAAQGTAIHALLLYDLAIRFLVMHECMHIVLGHTGFAFRELGLGRLMEMGAARRAHMPAVLSQSLEFIADRHTVNGVMHWALTGRLGSYVDDAARLSALRPDEFMLRSLTLALMTLLHLLPNRPGMRDGLEDSHPHPYLRMRWCCREMAAALDDRALCVKGVFEPFAYWLASFQRNFLAPGRWQEAVLEDEPDVEGWLPSDRAYEAITAAARSWQTKLWRTCAPLYPGDGRPSGQG